jgi:hypothetical protein
VPGRSSLDGDDLTLLIRLLIKNLTNGQKIKL